MSIYRNTILAVLAISFTLSCTNKEIPYIQGNMEGHITSIDENGLFIDDHQGVFVKAVSKTDSAETYADADGKFVLKDLNFGQYSMEMKKEGYGITYDYSTFDHVGGPQPTYLGKLSIYQISTKTIKLDSLAVNPNDQGYILDVYGEVSGNLIKYFGTSIVLFIGDSNVAHENFMKHQSIYVFDSQFKVSIVFDNNEIQETLGDLDKYHLVAYSTNNSVGGFWDNKTKKFKFPCIGAPSNVMEFAFE